jgi:hypothetical protein
VSTDHHSPSGEHFLVRARPMARAVGLRISRQRREMDPGQGIEPRPPGSEPGVLPVRRSRSSLRAGAPAPKHPPASGKDDVLSVHPASTESTQSRQSLMSRLATPNDVFQATRSALRPWIGSRRSRVPDGDCPTWRGFGARSSALLRKSGRLKQTLIRQHLFQRVSAEGLSLSSGASIRAMSSSS